MRVDILRQLENYETKDLLDVLIGREEDGVSFWHEKDGEDMYLVIRVLEKVAF